MQIEFTNPNVEMYIKVDQFYRGLALSTFIDFICRYLVLGKKK